MLLTETQTYRGRWWLPSAPDDRHDGNLTITKGDARLDLLGHFGHELISEGDRERVYSMWLADQERIVGVTTGGDYVTLVDCSQTGGSGLLRPDLETGIYRARAVIIGAAFDDDEPIEFDHVAIRVSALETWLGLTPLSVEPDATGKGGTIRYQFIEPMDFPLEGGETATLRFSMTSDGFGPGMTEATIKNAAWLGLRFGERRPLEDATRAVWRLRNFLSLATGKPLSVLAVNAFRDDFVGRNDEIVEMSIYYPLAHNPDPSERRIQPWELLFGFPQVRDRLSDVLAKWLALQEPYEPVLGLFLGRSTSRRATASSGSSSTPRRSRPTTGSSGRTRRSATRTNTKLSSPRSSTPCRRTTANGLRANSRGATT